MHQDNPNKIKEHFENPIDEIDSVERFVVERTVDIVGSTKLASQPNNLEVSFTFLRISNSTDIILICPQGSSPYMMIQKHVLKNVRIS